MPNQEHPSSQWMTSRSTDGGVTWTEHRAAFPDPRATAATLKPQRLTAPIDFSNPDIGYCRHVVRPDGKVVTVYYYRTKADGQSPTYIAATIWDADKPGGPLNIRDASK
jgi:hypothetical protein